MGAKDSKPSFISYEDAVKRVPDSDLRRIREAFKRCAGANGAALSLDAFVREVLCDGVPYEVAEWLYQASGGTRRGIAFRDLLCGIVVLTKGSLEEKIKFLWTLYVNNQNDNGTYIHKWDFARALHLENTSLPVSRASRTAEVLTGLFGPGDKATFDQFRSWLLIHKDATVLSKWLLADTANVTQDLETPTFYQSLAGVTHLEERDIIELEKCFWSLHNAAASGQLDLESLAPLVSPPLPASAVPGLFRAFDENADGHIDFKELCCGLSAACRGPRTERIKFCFKIFDLDRDGVLNKKELIDMVGILCTIANESKNHGSRASTPSDDLDVTDKGFDPEVILLNLRDKLVTNQPKNGRKPMFQLGPSGEAEDIIVIKQDISEKKEEGLVIGEDVGLSMEEFLIWSVESASALVGPCLDLLFEVCHVVLGLRPQCAHRERDIVLGWLRREVQRGYSVGQFWYLVAMEWWSAWVAYSAPGAADACCRHHRQLDDALVCDDSFTTNSSESMGSLVGSLGSGGSSSGVSSAPAPRAPRAPGPVDNRRLLAAGASRVSALTGEGGLLRRDVTLAQHRDFELVPDALWRALALWHGAPDPLPRQVIRPPNSDVELELYPIQLKLLRHVPSAPRPSPLVGAGGVAACGGAGGGAACGAPTTELQLAYTAAFSRLATVRQVCDFLCAALALQREDVRLWVLSGSGGGGAQVLLDDDRPTLAELGLEEQARLLLELRNQDLTWPEEIGALSGRSPGERRETLSAPELPGATGLHNLGNTCFMNAALQAVWNTGPLTRYFNSGMHLYEVNTANPLGTRGTLALRYGELCKQVWSMSARSVAPLRVRWCVSRYARALAGGGQHDAQELLAWLLDALHEDLNRAPPPAPLPPPPPPRDSDGRPDYEVAAEAWAHYAASNHSIITDLFCGQLKSRVRCDSCGHESVRFDPFNMLSLPLPMESFAWFEIKVILLDGSVPVKYGVRVNSEGTYLDLKKNLSELCGLPPESMLLVEVCGALLGRVFPDEGRVGGAGGAGGAGELSAYETPPAHHHHLHGEEGVRWASGGGGGGGAGLAGGARGEVSDPPSGLCMPALFCFKKSSEVVASSPPGTFASTKSRAPYTDTPGEYREGALLADPELHDGSSSPTLSVRSLDAPPSSPKLGKVKFASSPSNMYRMNEMKDTPAAPVGGVKYLIAVHRKQCVSEAYFLPAARCRVALFGAPLVVGVRGGMSGREVYARVWAQVARLLSPRPPPDHAAHNHATDCDDSLGYSFPFTLRLVRSPAAWCARCAWPDLCRGCALPSTARPLIVHDPEEAAEAGADAEVEAVDADSEVPDGESPVARAKFSRQYSSRVDRDRDRDSLEGGCGELRSLDVGALSRDGRPPMLAIDWDPTALHLRYQPTREKMCSVDASVARSARERTRAVDLASCLRAFTRDERLDEPYRCSHCRAMRPATKKLQIWRLPPILIIHLKRFQYVNNKWIKSQKVVDFPFQDFDPTEFLASVPQETILRHHELKNMGKRRSSMIVDLEDHISESEDEEPVASQQNGKLKLKIDKKEGRRERLESTSLVTTPVLDDNLVDYHKHHLKKDEDPFDLKYRLYAVVCHSGQLHGGHYVALARNPSGAWLSYNDSSCRRVAEPGAAPRVDAAAAYLLFYERRALHGRHYLPPRPPHPPPPPPPDTDPPHPMCAIA